MILSYRTPSGWLSNFAAEPNSILLRPPTEALFATMKTMGRSFRTAVSASMPFQPKA